VTFNSTEPTTYGQVLRGSFQKFRTLYVFSLKMNLFYKIRLQAFNVISIVLYHSGPTFGQVLYSCQDASLLMRLITQVASLDTSWMLLKSFPRSGFFNFGKKSKTGRLISGLYGGWGSTYHPHFSKISNTAPERRGRFVVQNEDNGCEHAVIFGESLDAKHLAETFCSS
jgi:hypothetical protein